MALQSNGTSPLPADDVAYVVLTVSVSTLSFFGSMLIISTYIAYGDLRTTSRKLLVFLSVADLLTAVGNLVGVGGYLHRALDSASPNETVYDEWLCVFPAALTIFSTISSFSWTVCIAIFLHLCIVRNRVVMADRIIWMFHVVSWLLPAGITATSIGSDVLGRGSVKASWCWIKSSIGRQQGLIWSFMTGPTWELIAVLLSLVLYTSIKWHIRKEIRREGYISHETMTVISQANRKLTFVPIVFILLRVWGLARFLVNINGTGDIVFLKLLQGIGDSGQGLANMILFCFFTSKIRRHMADSAKALVSRCTCSGCRQKSSGLYGAASSTYYARGTGLSGKSGNVTVNVFRDSHTERTPLMLSRP